MTVKYLLMALVILYFAAMVWVFFNAIRHFLAWFTNSIPPHGHLGALAEPLSMLFTRHLTKEGVTHRNSFYRWFATFLVMAALFALVTNLAPARAT